MLTSGLITSFMSSSNIFAFDTEKSNKMSPLEKKKKQEKIQKLLAIVLCFFQAAAYVLSGMYGKLDVVGTGNATIIVLQVKIDYNRVIFYQKKLLLIHLSFLLKNKKLMAKFYSVEGVLNFLNCKYGTLHSRCTHNTSS